MESLIIIFIAVNCMQRKERHHALADHPGEALASPGSRSLYDAEARWFNQDLKPVALNNLAGKIQVLTFGFTRCPGACPQLIRDMQAIDNHLPADFKDQIHYTFISIDPQHDTPQALKQFSEVMHLDRARWQLLTSSAGNILTLAMLMGMQYKETKDGFFAHSNIIHILNPQGELIHQQIGLNRDPQESVGIIRKLLTDKSN